jgi:hypothetical protein
MSIPAYTILINSTDSFEDCWYPFFKLFSVYWPNCDRPILLNTETKSFQYPGLNVVCSQVGAESPGKRLSWSQCLHRCLGQIDTPLILYLQDDYFLNSQVSVKQIDELADLMLQKDYTCIRLMECGGSGPWHPCEHPLLWEVDQRAKYRIALQAGLWNKQRLQNYLRLHESPWQLEVFGSKRAHHIADTIFCVNRDIFNDQSYQLFPYHPTGVVAGKWKREAVVDLFNRHGISVDFSVRGFYDPDQQSKKRPLWRRAMDRLRSLPLLPMNSARFYSRLSRHK